MSSTPHPACSPPTFYLMHCNMESQRPAKIRSACNRCHAQKLRCVLKPGQVQCERCLRLDTVCRFASRAPRGSQRTRTRSAAGETENMQQDAYTGDLQLLRLAATGHVADIELLAPNDDAWLGSLALTTELDHPQGVPTICPADITQLWDTDIPIQLPEPIPTSSTPSLASELASLSIALSDLSGKLPCTREGAPTSASTPELTTTPFILDDLFASTTHLTTLIESNIPVPTPSLSLTKSVYHDNTTSLLIAACTTQITALYLAVLHLIRRCLEHSLGPPRPRPGWAVVLPEVKMGVFSAPAITVKEGELLTPGVPVEKGKVFMYMWMTVVFSGDSLGRLGSMLRERKGQEVGLGDGTDGGAGQEQWQGPARLALGARLWEDMVERVDVVLRDVERTKGLLA
ncbi:Zn(II)2Cys6 transcription factor domain-containing protein [Aspergillus foveolatus]|uniref:Zn(II)2Cys6 transcription factor domain-containing protein n=1 Tax=Aspergillus foveolatus TaxID=210207 RepID=UPI003CCD7A8B